MYPKIAKILLFIALFCAITSATTLFTLYLKTNKIDYLYKMAMPLGGSSLIIMLLYMQFKKKQ